VASAQPVKEVTEIPSQPSWVWLCICVICYTVGDR
jgi:hypothetical protein